MGPESGEYMSIRFQKRIAGSGKTSHFIPVPASLLIGAFFFQLTAGAAEKTMTADCAAQFVKMVPAKPELKRYPPGNTTIRQWLDSMTAEEIKSFLPDDALINPRPGQFQESSLRKIITKLSARINLDHGALFAVFDSLSVLETLLRNLETEIGSEPISVRQALNELILGREKPASIEIPEGIKTRYHEVLDLYRQSLNENHPLVHDEIPEWELRQQKLNLKLIGRANDKDSELYQAIRFQAATYLDIAKSVRKRRNEAAELFSRIAKHHLTNEEVLMATFMTSKPDFEKHLGSHDSALKLFTNLSLHSDSELPLRRQLRQLESSQKIFRNWLHHHIMIHDREDYVKNIEAVDAERHFSDRQRPMYENSTRLKTRWRFRERPEFEKIEDYLYQALNSDKVLF
jgi:hypothetical protein